MIFKYWNQKEIIAGRDFSEEYGPDASEAFIVNEKQCKLLGFKVLKKRLIGFGKY